jgi:protein gp37
MKYFFDLLYRDGFAVKEPLVNVWLGVTAENQEQADKRIPILLEIPAAVRFVSVEPMIGPVSLAGFDGKIYRPWLDTIAWTKAIDWIICGCESGLRRRKTEWAWIRSLQEQCESAKVPFFLKQGELGGKVVKAPYDQYLQLPSSIAPRKETRNIWHESDPSSN